MNKVFVFLADGFEEIEGLTVVDLLRRADIDTETVSIGDSTKVVGAHQIEIEADSVFCEGMEEEGTMFVLPGGMPGTLHLGECKQLTDLLLRFHESGKKVAAICAAPSILGDLGILKGRDAVCYPGFEDRLEGANVTRVKVAADGGVTTSRGMGTAIPFALALVEQLVSKEKAAEVKKSIIYGHEN